MSATMPTSRGAQPSVCLVHALDAGPLPATNVVITQVMEVLKLQADEKGLEITKDLSGLMARRVKGDFQRLRQILINLIGNAVKFTERGTVDVTVRQLPSAALNIVPMRSEVSDTDIGIEEDQIPKLFCKFTQADAIITRRFGGTGLGLSICRELVALMGATIGVTNNSRLAPI